MKIKDEGIEIPTGKISQVKEISALKDVVKAMGGKLRINSSSCEKTTFEL